MSGSTKKLGFIASAVCLAIVAAAGAASAQQQKPPQQPGQYVIGQFRHEDLAAWLTRYCAANPQTRLPLAIHALGHAMLAHPGGPLS